MDHREPDRVPVDLGATPSSGISVIAYSRLASLLGVRNGHSRIYDVVQQLAQPEETVIERLGVDVLDIGRTFNASDDDWQPTLFPTGARRNIRGGSIHGRRRRGASL